MERRSDQDKRQQATWMSLLLSVQCGETITVADLLGEEEPEGESLEDANERFERLAARHMQKGK